MKNSFIKVLSFVMALTMIVGCFTAISFSAAECNHTKGDVVKTVPATCIDTGYTVYKCSTCSKEFVADVTPATETHTPVDVTGSAATCDSPALAAGKKCSVCGTVISGCGPVAGSAPLMHDWKETKTPATCGAKEALVHTCVRCGKTADQLKAAYDALSAEAKEKFPAAVLDDIKANLKEEFGNALVHKWDYAVKTAPTTCVDGVTVATCENCGKVEEFAIKATHNFVKIENADRACVDGKLKDGKTGDPKACSFCGVFDENTEAKSEIKHNYVYVGGDNRDAKVGDTGFEMSSVYQALGLKAGDKLYNAATCKKAGSYLGRCACGAYSFVDIAVSTTHTYSDWAWKVGSADATAANLDSKIAAKLCTDAIVRSRKCSVCEKTETVTVVAAGSHNLEVEVVAPTCTTEGYTVSDCKVCSYVKKDAYVAKLGHSYGDAVVTGDCKSGIISTKTCTVCSHAEPTTVKAAGDHNYIEGATNVVKVAPTCTAKGYYGYKCADCDSIKRENELGEWGEKDSNNHTRLEFVNAEKPYVYGKEASCNATGKFFKKCTACGTDTNVVTVEVDAPKLAHEWGTSYATSNGTIVKNYNEVAATCQKTGLTVGYCCIKCGADDPTRKQTVVEKNPNNHVGGMTLISSHDATCVAAGYDKYLTACCGYVTVPNGKTATGNHDYKTVEFKAPTCTEAGNHEYKKCDCGLVDLTSIVLPTTNCTCGLNHDDLKVSKDYTIPALGGHDFEISDANKATHVIAEQPETCTANGKKAYIICENGCGAYLIDGAVVVDTVAASNDNGVDERKVALLILPHGDKYRATVANKAATCTETGIAVTDLMKDANGKVCTKCYNKTQANGGYVVEALNHAFASKVINDDDSDEYNCTEATYTLQVCGRNNCDVSYAENYTAGVAAHNWSAVKDTNKTKDDKVCIEGVREAYKCVTCSKYNYVVKTAPVAHKYSTGVTGADVAIDLSCTAIKDFHDKTCETCGKKVDASETPADGALTAIHKIATATQELTCTQDGFSIVYCSACDTKFSTDYVKAPGHLVYNSEAEAKADTANVYSVVKCTPATNTTDGSITYVCNICKEEVTLTIPAIQGLALNVKAADSAVANNQVKLNVTLSASNYAFNEIKFKINKNGAQVALADVAVAVDYAFAATDAVTAVASDNGSYIEVLVYVPNGADGKAKNVTVSGTDAAFLTITLDVLATANGGVAIATDSAAIIDVAYINDNAEVAHKTNATITAAELKTSVIGDVNGDLRLDAGDSIVIQSAIYAGTYNVVADFDKNGKVDLADHVAFVKFVTSRQTVLDYLAVMGITVEDIVADMKLAYDLDFDRAVGTDNDKAVLVAAVTETLANCAYTTFATTYRCSIDEFVAKTAHDIVVPPSVQ